MLKIVKNIPLTVIEWSNFNFICFVYLTIQLLLQLLAIVYINICNTKNRVLRYMYYTIIHYTLYSYIVKLLNLLMLLRGKSLSQHNVSAPDGIKSVFIFVKPF